MQPARTQTRFRRRCRCVANILAITLAVSSLGAVQHAHAQNLTDAQLGIVVNNLAVGATHR